MNRLEKTLTIVPQHFAVDQPRVGPFSSEHENSNCSYYVFFGGSSVQNTHTPNYKNTLHAYCILMFICNVNKVRMFLRSAHMQLAHQNCVIGKVIKFMNYSQKVSVYNYKYTNMFIKFIKKLIKDRFNAWRRLV